ncbi:MAG: hypothetical protein Q8Q09_28705 [Deltaproteobacteria bacterium]|nr:hypothetical protein [Deltaproteobacteria bacterium]
MKHSLGLTLLATLSCFFSLGGCGPDCTEITGPLAIEIGAGDPENPSRFTAYSPGSCGQLTRGNQGGQHVWIAVRATNFCNAGLSLRAEVVQLQAAPDPPRTVSFASSTLGWRELADRSFVSEPLAMVLNGTYAENVQIQVQVTDRLGRMATASVPLRRIMYGSDGCDRPLDASDQDATLDATNTD